MTLDGGVAGVVNAGRGDSIGFAISAPLTRRVVDALVDGDGYEHSYMGVEIRSVGPLLAEANDVDVGSGVYVNAVRDGAPSDGVLRGSTEETTRNGLTVDTGGDVVVAMDGTAIPTRQALSSFLALETVPGDTVEVTVVRDGGRRTVDLTLETRPDP